MPISLFQIGQTLQNAATNAASAGANALATLAQNAAAITNHTVIVKLDDFGFSYTEVPDSVKFGLKEQIGIHKLIGGVRVLDMVGDDPADFSWAGTFLGPTSTTRAQELYALQQEKRLITLTFGSISRKVVISELDLVYKRGYWIDYSITCVVVDTSLSVGGVVGGATGASGSGNATPDPKVGQALINGANQSLAAPQTPNDAGNALQQGVAGQSGALEAGGIPTGNAFSIA